MADGPEWSIQFADEFDEEFEDLSEVVQDELLANIKRLQAKGPFLKRPHADKLKKSDYPNMKELRFEADDGVWRIAFAFDPSQKGIVLVAGDKSGGSEKRFYKQLIRKADKRYSRHLDSLKKE